MKGTENPADVHTKALTKPKFESMLALMNIRVLPDYIKEVEESKCAEKPKTTNSLLTTDELVNALERYNKDHEGEWSG